MRTRRPLTAARLAPSANPGRRSPGRPMRQVAWVCMLLLPGLACFGLENPFPSSVVQSVYDRVVPALCLVSYTSEITNPVSGQTSQRYIRALGVIVSPDGLVLAHGHMQVENNRPFNVRVKVGHGEEEYEYEATVLRKPEDVNLSLVQIKTDRPEKFPYLEFKQHVALKLGEPIIVCGLLGETLDFNPAVQFCRIGAVLDKPRTTYCLDHALPFGFVTGPVANERGELVGVIGFDLASEEGGELYVRSGHPLVYQTDLFLSWIHEPPSETELKQDKPEAWLGVFTQPLTDDLAEYWSLPKRGGVVVSTVVPGSPAEEAGLERGDVITEFGGVPVRAKQDPEVLTFTKLVREVGVGRPVSFTVLRSGKPLELEVTLVELPKSAREAAEHEDAVLGLTVREITTDLRIHLNLPDTVHGVIVRRVRSGSWAHLAGVMPGVIVLSLGGHATGSLDEYKASLEKIVQERPAEIPVFCQVGARTGFFRIRPHWGQGE